LPYLLPRLAAAVALSLLAACGTPTVQSPTVTAGYEGVEDSGFFIAPVEARFLTEGVARTEVEYTGGEAPGTIVIDTHARRLYFVEEGNRAWRYKIGIGREGTSLTRGGSIGRKEVWPSWQPTGNMLRKYPEIYGPYAGGTPGGLDSPLGARAMYLHRGGRDTFYRIHGTIDDASIGRASSAGCVRLFNQDAIHLFEQVTPGTLVTVRSAEESLALEGQWMNDINGNAVPDTPENRAALEKALAEEAKTAAASGGTATQG
jgi:lipoprotein-anchoring transpeptidase ErfK/SrfK